MILFSIVAIKKGIKKFISIGIVIGNIKCGDGLAVWQNVTIGSHGNVNKEPAYPTLGDNVRIFANSVIFGDVSIGRNSVIGAMSLVNSDVPEDSIRVWCPSKIGKTGRVERMRILY